MTPDRVFRNPAPSSRAGTSRALSSVALLASVALLGHAGCAHYTTPGGPAPLLELAEKDIAEILSVSPASPFPARIAIGRVQESRYSGYGQQVHGNGPFRLVTTRDVEDEASFRRLATFPQVIGVAPLSFLVIGEELETFEDLREGAARLRADLLLLYTLDTEYWRRDLPLQPLSTFSLGIFPSGELRVSSTASAVLIDVRTGFLYGLAESTVTVENLTSWLWGDGVEWGRRKTGSEAFSELMDEIATLWQGVLAEHGGERGKGAAVLPAAASGIAPAGEPASVREPPAPPRD